MDNKIRTIEALLKLPTIELARRADSVRAAHTGSRLDICTILNAKSGACAEDCKFCAQSCRHRTGIEAYPLKSAREIIDAARAAKDSGARRFGIVTSGNTLTEGEVRLIGDAASAIKAEVGIKVCASLGRMTEEGLAYLKKAGVSRYHHNIETSPRYFRKIVSTHTFADRVETIKLAQKVGLEVCSGGIIGMGETWRDRIEMALILKKLGVDSVPVNVLIPIGGTSLAAAKRLSCDDAIRTIAIFRIILKDKAVKLAAGRETSLKDHQALAFMAGANGMLIGGYLTVKGRAVAEDRKLIEEIKYSWKR